MYIINRLETLGMLLFSQILIKYYVINNNRYTYLQRKVGKSIKHELNMRPRV